MAEYDFAINQKVRVGKFTGEFGHDVPLQYLLWANSKTHLKVEPALLLYQFEAVDHDTLDFHKQRE